MRFQEKLEYFLIYHISDEKSLFLVHHFLVSKISSKEVPHKFFFTLKQFDIKISIFKFLKK
jgi:hypothetical protein